MTMSIPKIPMEDGLIDQCTDFLHTSTELMRELRKCMARMENVTDSYLCGAKVTTREGELEVQMLKEGWLMLANVWPHDLMITSHYTSGPETEKPWEDHLFCVSLKHNGVTYFSLMTGAEIDRAGIDVTDKKALLRGDVLVNHE